MRIRAVAFAGRRVERAGTTRRRLGRRDDTRLHIAVEHAHLAGAAGDRP